MTTPSLPPGQPPPVPQPKPQPKRKRVKVEPEPGGQLEQLLIENKKAHDEAEIAGRTEEEYKAAIKAYLLSLLAMLPEGETPPGAFDIAPDPHGRYPGYTLTLKGGKRFDSKRFFEEHQAVYEAYEVDIKPGWELRESTVGRRRK